MPFAVFRRHQKKLLAIFAILAMFGFVLSDTLARWSSSGRGAVTNPIEVESLFGKPVRRAELAEMADRRAKANRFISLIRQVPDFFGGLTTRDLVDAKILEHEADRLGIPKDTDLALNWLKRETGGRMNQALFDSMLKMTGPDVYAEEILSALSSEIRLLQVQQLLGNPLVTPLDVFQTYRDQNERSSYKAISFPVANYTDKVGEPSEADLAALFGSYKDALPDPTKDTPGFKIPQQVKVEILSVDSKVLAKQIEAKLTEAELKAYYENHKAELTPARELPDDLFAKDPEAKLTPPLYRPFDQLKDTIVGLLSAEKAQEEITAKFDKIKDDVINKFADNYHTTRAEIEEQKKAGEQPKLTLPTPTELSAVAKENGLTYEMSPLLTREEATNYGQVSAAGAGSSPSIDEPKFADVVFDDRNQIFDGLEFSDFAGRRYLVRKMADIAPHASTLEESKPKVIAAWKINKARDLAEKAAKEAEAKIKADGGVIKDQIVLGRPVIAIDGLTRRRPGMPIPGAFMQYGESTPAEIPQLSNPGDALRDALFGLTGGQVAMAPNAPKDTYYVLTLAKKDQVGFNSLYGPTSSPFPYMDESLRSAVRTHVTKWLKQLRQEAGLPENWAPRDEKEKAAARKA